MPRVLILIYYNLYLRIMLLLVTCTSALLHARARAPKTVLRARNLLYEKL